MNIPHNKPYIGKAEAQAAYDVVMSGHLAAGEKCKQVEAKWCELTDSEDSVCVSSGLTALKLALRALELDSGSNVVLAGYNCVAPHNAVLSIGSKFLLTDIKPDLTIDSDSVTKWIKSCDVVDGIIATHLFGAYADIESLKGFGISIIEDMAHGIFKQTADLAISSFYPTKLIQSNGGGIVSGSKKLIDKVRDYQSYGNKAPSFRQNDLSNDVTAAMALVQLNKLDEIRELRKEATIRYNILITERLFSKQFGTVDVNKTNYRYTIRVPNAKEVAEKMQSKGVIAHQPVWDYRSEVDWPSDLKGCDKAWETVLSLPFYPDITVEEQMEVVKVLGECLENTVC